MKIVIEMKPQTWALVREGHIPVRAYECIVKGTPLRYVLDEIRAEIEQLPTQTRTNWNGCCPDIDYPEIEYIDITKHQLLSIIDKYKESEE